MIHNRLVVLFSAHKSVKALVAIGLLVLFAAGIGYTDVNQSSSNRHFGIVRSGADIPAPDIMSGTDTATKDKVIEQYGRLPMSFEANQGQTDRQVKFFARGGGYTLFLASTEAVLTLKEPLAAAALPLPSNLLVREETLDLRSFRAQRTVVKNSGSEKNPYTVLRMKLVGANTEPKITGLAPLPGRSNYFIGKDRKKWRTNIPHYAKVKYEAVYSGIDMVYYGNQQQLEYDFIVAPGADPKAIQLAFQGADKLSLDDKGNLILHMGDSQVIQHKPIIYQEINGVRQSISGYYLLLKPATPRPRSAKRDRRNSQLATRKSELPTLKSGLQMVGFKVAAYDTGRPLIIDPVLSYSTYLGGTYYNAGWDYGWDFATDIAVDSSDNAYIVGETWSTDFPTVNPYQGFSASGYNIFVSKLNPDGDTLLYSTYLGGSGNDDEGGGIDVDTAGNIYVVGLTDSTDFPTSTGAFDTGCGTDGNCNYDGAIYYLDAFVTKLNDTGDTLLYSTYLGGSGDDLGIEIAVDNSNNAYVTGLTASSEFPTANAYQNTNAGGTWDAFVAKLDTAASGTASLVYSTYLGGSDDDRGIDIALDASGSAYIAGATTSGNFPSSPGAYDTSCGTDGTCDGGIFDAFVTKLNTAGDGFVYSTFLGDNGIDRGVGIALDASNNACVTGRTNSDNFPVSPGAYDTSCGTDGACDGGLFDVFVTMLNTAGDDLVYSTFLGGSGDDYGVSVAVDTTGDAYVTGRTTSTDFPTESSIQGTYGGGDYDVFVTKLNSGGSGLIYSTYIGGSADYPGWYDLPSESAQSIAVDNSGNVYVTGYTWSTDFPTVNAYQNTNAEAWDAFILKIADTPQQYTLTVTKDGTGTGTVTSSPAGIDCGSDCTETYDAGTVVTLTAIADAGSTFAGWSGGGCSGTGDCVVTTDANTTVTATFNTCDISFTDVSPGYWAEDYINAIACSGITTGYGDGTYRPVNTVNRAEMAAFIIRALYGETFSYSIIPYFSDVAETHWAFKYIQKMYEDGITTGYGDGTYRPVNTVNRAEMAAFIIRALYGETFSYSGTPYFPDVADTHWAFKYIQEMYEDGITTGYGDGTYGAGNTVNRAEMAAFLARAFLGIP